jgi:methionine biosynthesis protein MetW
MKSDSTRFDYETILGLVRPRTTALDLGCGDGELLASLARERQVRGQGIEIDSQAVYQCVARGISVIHGDIDSALADYADNAFDYVILNQSFQQVKQPDTVLQESLRVGRDVIVGFPNFAQLSARFQIAIRGKTPVTPSLPFAWYNTPNVHFLSISDFIEYCRDRGIRIKKSVYIGKNGRVRICPNAIASSGIFLITQQNNGEREDDRPQVS